MHDVPPTDAPTSDSSISDGPTSESDAGERSASRSGPGSATPRPRRVCVVGGGVAGLTVAHELARLSCADTPIDIEVIERREELGGRARSVRVNGAPGEHAMRILLASYNSLYQTMREIPVGGRTVFDHLVASDIRLVHDGAFVQVPSMSTSRWAHLKATGRILRFLHERGVTAWELLLFFFKSLRLLWMSPERQRDELGAIAYDDYVSSDTRSQAFRDVLLQLPEIFVAAKRTACAILVAKVMLEYFIAPFLRTGHALRGFVSLDGPTSERFITPWVEHLRGQGVRFRTGRRVKQLVINDGEVAGLTLDDDSVVEADQYVLALPRNITSALLADDAPGRPADLRSLDALGQEWSNGLQLFLKDIPEDWRPFVGTHTMIAGSPWSIVFILQSADVGERRGIWRAVPLPDGMAGVLSVVFSNVMATGLHHRRTFKACTRDEVMEEVLHQLELALPPGASTSFVAGREALIAGVHGPDLVYLPASSPAREMVNGRGGEYRGFARATAQSTGEQVLSDVLLHIRAPGDLAREPGNATWLHNLMLAGEFTRTTFETPTMEKANESGKRCAEVIARRFGLAYDASRYAGSELPGRSLRRLDGRWYSWRRRDRARRPLPSGPHRPLRAL